MDIKLDLLPESKRGNAAQFGTGNLPFGLHRTDHMFLMNFDDGQWHDPRIVPYGPIELMPGANCLHYGQALFEGAKAFRHADGEIYAFRPEKNAARLNHSASVLCMQSAPEDMQLAGLMRLLDIERDWCPGVPESSMYIRPFMFGTEDSLGVKPSSSYIYCIMLSPSGPYYPGGFNQTVTLLVTDKYHRAVSGGTGSSKAAGNYAASLQAQLYAHDRGAGQVLYLDSSNKYIDEAGTMNHFHVMKDGTFIVPEFVETILRSVTSESVMDFLPKLGLSSRQERVTVADFREQIASGDIIEAGGLGTAAVITPVGSYLFDDDGQTLTVGDGQIGKHTRALYEAYTAIQTGKAEDVMGWLTKIPHF